MELEPSLPTHHPTSHPNPHHRKIELQSPLDLTYLQTNLSASAQQKLDLHFPPSALRRKPAQAQPATFISLDGADASSPQIQLQTQVSESEEVENDPLRARVQLLVSTFLQRTWSGAAQNITINGLDASSASPNNSNTFPSTSNATLQANGNSATRAEQEGVDFTYAPYDARLQQHLASLYGELEVLTAQVSRLRREAPSTGAQRYFERLRAQMLREEEDYDAQMRILREERKQGSGTGEGRDVLELERRREGYFEDVRSTYERGLEELGRLAGVSKAEGSSGQGGGGGGGGVGGSLTETVGKVQRARTVAVEFE